jgi:hypothetical protein
MGVGIVRLPRLWRLRPCGRRQPRSRCDCCHHTPRSVGHTCLRDLPMLKTSTPILNPGIIPGSRQEAFLVGVTQH